MFYDISILTKGGKFCHVWLAATITSKFIKTFSRRSIDTIPIGQNCDNLLQMISSGSAVTSKRFSLYLSSQLMYGIIVVYQIRMNYLYEDCCRIFYVRKRKASTDIDNVIDEPPHTPRKRRPTTSRVSPARLPSITTIQPVVPDINAITLRDDIPDVRRQEEDFIEGGVLNLTDNILGILQDPMPFPFDAADTSDVRRVEPSSDPKTPTPPELQTEIPPPEPPQEAPQEAPQFRVPDIVVRSPRRSRPNLMNVTLDLSELGSLDSDARARKTKKPKKLRIDRTIKIPILYTSQDETILHISCADKKSTLAEAHPKTNSEILLRRPIHKAGLSLSEFFNRRCVVHQRDSSQERIRIPLPVSASLQPQGRDTPAQESPLGNINQLSSVEHDSHLIPPMSHSMNVPGQLGSSVVMHQDTSIGVIEPPAPDPVPQIETPLVAPEPELIPDVVEREPESRKNKWKSTEILKKLEQLWGKKIQPIRMAHICSNRTNTKLDAAYCFRGLLQLYAGRYIRVVRNPVTSEIMDIQRGSRRLKPRVLQLEEEQSQDEESLPELQ